MLIYSIKVHSFLAQCLHDFQLTQLGGTFTIPLKLISAERFGESTTRLSQLLSSIKIMIIFNNTSTEINTKSADVLLKMTTILKELRIVQLQSKNEQTLRSGEFT